MDNKQLLINCSCNGNEILKFLSFEKEPHDNEYDKEIYISILGEEIFGFKNKLKTIWSIIRYGECKNYGILADQKDIKKIIDYLDETLDYWESLDKKPFCRHELISIEENPFTRYGTKASYIACKICHLEISEAQEQCEHYKNPFGVCHWCHKRFDYFNCKHIWTKEPNTNDEYCEFCGEWKDEVE
jgi:hypothetical protein